MSDPVFKIEGTEVPYPANLPELQYDISFDKDLPEVDVSINEWEFTKEHKAFFDAWRTEHFFEGAEATLDVNGEGNIADTLEFLLAVKDANPISCDRETIPAIDRLNQLKQNRKFTFEYLREGAGWNHSNFNFIDIPYCKNAPKDAEVFMTLLSTAFLVIEIENLLDELIDKIVNASSFEWGEWIAMIPFFLKAVSVSLASIQILEQLYNLIVQPVKYHKAMKLRDMMIVGYSWLGYEFKSTVFDEDPFNQIYILPKRRQVPFNDDPNNNIILDILGLNVNVLKGFTTPSDDQTAYYDKDFDTLITGIKRTYNLKEFLEDPVDGKPPVIRLEKKKYKPFSDRVTLDPVDIDEWTFNSDDFTSNYSVFFSLDPSEINTIQNYHGTEFNEFITPPDSGIKNRKNLLVSGLKEIAIPFARGTRKTELNKSEIMLDKLFTAVEPIINEFVFQHNVKMKQATFIATTFIDITNDIISAIDSLPGIDLNGFSIGTPSAFTDVPYLTVPDFSELISDRIGMLITEEDEFEIDKMILVDSVYTLSTKEPIDSAYLLAPQFFGLFDPDNLANLQGIVASGESARQNRLDERNADIVNAEYIWKHFHYYESFVPNINGVTDWINGEHGQYKKYDAKQFLLCVNDVKKLKRSNFVSWCGMEGEFFSNLVYDPFSGVAEGKFKIKGIYYDKLISTKIVPNGSTRSKKF